MVSQSETSLAFDGDLTLVYHCIDVHWDDMIWHLIMYRPSHCGVDDT
jgi:hypothetical protein